MRHGQRAHAPGAAVAAGDDAGQRRYLEERGELEKATTLYHKAGNAGKALELCFAHDLFEPLAGIVKSVADDEDADPKLVAKCAAYFLDNGRYDDAARLLVKGGDHAGDWSSSWSTT